MSTNLEQSKWLDKVARGIERECPKAASVISTAYGTSDLIVATCPICNSSGTVHPYAETGVAGWLRDRPCEMCSGEGFYTSAQPYADSARILHAPCPTCRGSSKKGSEWPSMVWTTNLIDGQPNFLRYQTETWNLPIIHALDLLDAFALLEGVDWRWWKSPTGVFLAQHYNQLSRILQADSPGELLDKIMVEEEKHGAADGR